MKTKLLTTMLIACVGCSLTAPDGKKELLDDIERDRLQQREDPERSFLGAPRFVKVRQYHVYSDGNIYGKRWVMYQLDRRHVDVDKLLEELQE